MAGLSFIGYFISVPFMLKNGIDFITIVERSLDLITTTVPPSLPACLGIGISYALMRLRKWGIICINRESVNVCGRVNMVCFDKTGTLTEDNLDVYGFRPTKLSKSVLRFDCFASSCKEIQKEAFYYYKEMAAKEEPALLRNKPKDLKKLFIECLASCHGITRVDGKIIGDPIDVKMFEASNWELNENLEDQENYDSLVIYPTHFSLI
jgi:cation-transporting ATPase 13A3/4/5